MRKISVERTYALGQYQNIKLYNEFEIPEGKELDEEYIEKIEKLIFIHLELMYRKYLTLAEKLSQLNKEEAMQILSAFRDELGEN